VHQSTAQTLDAVGAGFVERFAGCDVGIDIGIAQRSDAYLAGDQIEQRRCVCAPGINDCQTGIDSMRFSRKAAQHATCVIRIDRFIEHRAFKHHNRISADDNTIGRRCASGMGFAPGAQRRMVEQRQRQWRQRSDNLRWRVVFVLLGIRGDDPERHAQIREQLTSARRGGCQNQG
jgi:hypothetical protein